MTFKVGWAFDETGDGIFTSFFFFLKSEVCECLFVKLQLNG